jgi:hypothetical protein
LAYVYTMQRRNQRIYVERELKVFQQKLKTESLQRQRLLKAYGVKIGTHEEKGRALFRDWMHQLGKVGETYGPKITETFGENLLAIAKLTDDQMEAMYAKIGCNEDEKRMFRATLSAYRYGLVYNQIRSKDQQELEKGIKGSAYLRLTLEDDE